jgi:hypothetical protein
VIKESRLPDFIAAGDGGPYSTFQSANPNTKSKTDAAMHEQMNVLRHDNIATYCNVVISSAETISPKLFVDVQIRQQLLAMQRSKCDKV